MVQLDKHAAETRQENPVLRKAIGQVYREKERFGKAIEQLLIAAEVQPNDAETYQALLACYDHQNDQQGAVEQILAWRESGAAGHQVVRGPRQAPGKAGADVRGRTGLHVERVQFFFGGQNFCWYLNGWRGPGWYWCGYAWRSGYGWGGGYGWNGWRQPGWNGGRWGRHDGDWRHRDGSGSYTPHSAPHMSAIPHMSSGGNGKRWPK